jgi:hypothetical protein
MHTPILDLAWPSASDHPSDHLVRDYWELHALEEPGEPITFQLPYGTWIRLFRENGLVVEDLLELRPPADAKSTYYREDCDLDWARRWPMEHTWRVRKAHARSRIGQTFQPTLRQEGTMA